MAPTYKLTYYNVRGLAEPIRLLFHYANVQFEDYRLDRSEWPTAKENFPWGVLPLLEIDGSKLSQSFAIGRYLGKEFNLTGSDEFESATCDAYGELLKDLLNECRGLFVETDEVKKAELRENIIRVQVPKYIGGFDKYLAGNGGQYLVGKKLTWIDIFAAYYFDFLESFISLRLLDNYSYARAYTKNILDIPQIKAWIETRPVTPL